MLNINVKGGTPKHDGKRLCDSCSFGTVMESVDGKEFIYCGQVESQISRKITKCNDYKDMSDKNEYELERIAWILETKNGRVIGFKPPKRRIDED
ncbi:hypothetical protein IID10_14955 [candidate division KSB1 bacterium]|nr:hypothetical protein [candidate division KSB1 bacterium]